MIYGTAGSGKTTVDIRVQKLLIKIAKIFNKKVIISGFQRSTVASWYDRAQLKDSTYLNLDRFCGNTLKNGLMQKDTNMIPKYQLVLYTKLCKFWHLWDTVDCLPITLSKWCMLD